MTHDEHLIENAVTFVDGKVPQYITNIHTPLSASAEFSCECEVNRELFERVTGRKFSPDITHATSFSFTGQPVQVQKRRHKKKRINKKWAKRYGYTTKLTHIRLMDVSLVGDSNDFEIIGRSMTCHDIQI